MLSIRQIAIRRKGRLLALKLEIGDILILKKNHPCGGNRFMVMRTGMDFRLKCLTCNTQIWIDRPNLEKRVRGIEPANQKPE